MTVPGVTLTERDGSLGSLPDGAVAMAFMGPADAAATLAVDTPAAYGRVRDVIAALVGGQLCESACYHIANTGLPAIVVRTGATTAATESVIDVTHVVGTSVVTLGADTTANDDYEIKFTVVTGGTIGIAGITLTYSLDGGRTPSAVQALGTATTYAVPGSGGVGFAFAAGTLVAGDYVTFRTYGPNFNSTELGTAITALKNSALAWEQVTIATPLDATTFGTVETAFGSMPEKSWIASARMPLLGESEATYLAAMVAIFGSLSTTVGCMTYGASKLTSGVNFRQYRRPPCFQVGSRLGAVSHEIDIAAPNLGSLKGTAIRDANGNPSEHDETVNPGADDARFTVLRTIDGIPGVYVNNARIFSAPGSDFKYVQHRRVMNIAKAALRLYFMRRLSEPVRVDKRTGFILETEAQEIDAGATAAMSAVLGAAPKASDWSFRLNRTDNILATETIAGGARITPLAYPKTFNLDIAFRNPALSIITA